MAWKILDLFLPREVEFFKLMNRQAEILVQSAEKLDEFIVSADRMTEAEIAADLRVMKDMETEGDEVERKVIEKLHTSFITPIDREDIHSIVTGLDNAIDAMNGAAKDIEVYGLRPIPGNIVRLCKITLDASRSIQSLIRFLEKKNSVDQVSAIIKRVHDLEKQADGIFHDTMAALFRTETSAGRIIMQKEIYQRLEGTTDLLDHIAKIIRGVVVKQG
jgi:predicted phosphate transport protein (TIGR00153 family)